MKEIYEEVKRRNEDLRFREFFNYYVDGALAFLHGDNDVNTMCFLKSNGIPDLKSFEENFNEFSISFTQWLSSEAAKEFLKNEPDLGIQALGVAAEAGDNFVIEPLMEILTPEQCNEPITKGDYKGETPLLVAESRGHDKVSERLLAKLTPEQCCKPIKAGKHRGLTLLFVGVRETYSSLVNGLLVKLEPEQCNEPAKAVQYEGETPLTCSIRTTQKDFVELLLKKLKPEQIMTPIQAGNGKHSTPLWIAVSLHLIDFIPLFLTILKPQQVNMPIEAGKNKGITPLFFAATQGYLEIVISFLGVLLSEHVLQPMGQGHNCGWVPVLGAAQHGHTEVVRVLLAKTPEFKLRPRKLNALGRLKPEIRQLLQGVTKAQHRINSEVISALPTERSSVPEVVHPNLKEISIKVLGFPFTIEISEAENSFKLLFDDNKENWQLNITDPADHRAYKVNCAKIEIIKRIRTYAHKHNLENADSSPELVDSGVVIMTFFKKQKHNSLQHIEKALKDIFEPFRKEVLNDLSEAYKERQKNITREKQVRALEAARAALEQEQKNKSKAAEEKERAQQEEKNEMFNKQGLSKRFLQLFDHKVKFPPLVAFTYGESPPRTDHERWRQQREAWEKQIADEGRLVEKTQPNSSWAPNKKKKDPQGRKKSPSPTGVSAALFRPVGPSRADYYAQASEHIFAIVTEYELYAQNVKEKPDYTDVKHVLIHHYIYYHLIRSYEAFKQTRDSFSETSRNMRNMLIHTPTAASTKEVLEAAKRFHSAYIALYQTDKKVPSSGLHIKLLRQFIKLVDFDNADLVNNLNEFWSLQLHDELSKGQCLDMLTESINHIPKVFGKAYQDVFQLGKYEYNRNAVKMCFAQIGVICKILKEKYPDTFKKLPHQELFRECIQIRNQVAHVFKEIPRDNAGCTRLTEEVELSILLSVRQKFDSYKGDIAKGLADLKEISQEQSSSYELNVDASPFVPRGV